MNRQHLLTIGILVFLAACADTPYKEAKHPIVMGKRGEQTTKYPNGVSITRYKESGQDYALGMDDSGDGAVLCAREMYISFLGPLTHCLRNSSPTVVSEIENSIERIDNFIVANNPEPVDREALRRRTAEALTSKVLLAKENPEKYCNVMLKKARKHFPHRTSKDWAAELKKATDKLLAKPRVPVMNPCL